MDIPAPIDEGSAIVAAGAARAGAVARPGFRAWLGLAVMVLLGFVSFLDRQIIALMVTPIEHDLKISDTQIGLLQGAAFGLVYPVFAIPMGYAADRFSRRWVIFLSVLFWAIAAMASGLANSFGGLFAARVGVGLGEVAVVPAIASLLGDIFPRHKLATVFSIYGSGVLIGGGGALWIGGAVLAWAAGGLDAPILGHLQAWQVAFIVTGAPAALLAVLVFLAPEPPRTATPGRSEARWPEVFAFLRQTWRFLACYTVGQSLLYVVNWGYLAWLPAIMSRAYHWSMLEIGSMLGIFTIVCGLPGQMTNGVVVDRMFRKREDAHLRYYVLGAAIIAVCGVLAPLAQSPLLYLLILAPLKFMMNFAGVFIACLLVATPNRMRGRVTALTGMVTGLVGSTAGPSLVAFFTDTLFHDRARVIWSMALSTGLLMPLAGLLFWLGLKPMRAAVRRERLTPG